MDLRVNDLVWAKMKGYPAWPARISEPKKGHKRLHHYVYFFGTNNYAWILDEHISHHSQELVDAALQKKNVSSPLKAAVEEIVAEAKLNPPSVARQLALKYRKLKEVRSKLKAPKKKFFGVPTLQVHKKGRVRADPYEFDDESSSLPRVPHVPPTTQHIGFIGLGFMGRHIVRRLLETGHHVTVWNRFQERCDEMARRGALRAACPADVIAACDLTFCCVAGPEASKAVLFSHDGVLKGLERARKAGSPDKGYVELTTLDDATSQEIGEAVRFQGGRYLEAQMGYSTREHAQSGMLVVLAAGDPKLFKECETCFHAAVHTAYWVGSEAGPAAQLGLACSAVSGAVCAAVGECLALADRMAVKRKDLLDIAAVAGFKCALVEDKFLQPRQFLSGPSVSIRNQQKHLHLALSLAQSVSHPTHVLATANEMYKQARSQGYDRRDASAVYLATKF
ncbi:hypothetical protein JTE90_006103 [Oedothorax gibbosus]|uniref:Cytokine-like nuclear factor N-PAC n=1 Tax=Oedothorax gibbosus TaxID=931172 RepID=A0AAV6V6M0_9ARAC|nr:hypothetical protein JTE90_006103 [Oedothorax gibbosus]